MAHFLNRYIFADGFREVGPASSRQPSARIRGAKAPAHPAPTARINPREDFLRSPLNGSAPRLPPIRSLREDLVGAHHSRVQVPQAPVEKQLLQLRWPHYTSVSLHRERERETRRYHRSTGTAPPGAFSILYTTP